MKVLLIWSLNYLLLSENQFRMKMLLKMTKKPSPTGFLCRDTSKDAVPKIYISSKNGSERCH